MVVEGELVELALRVVPEGSRVWVRLEERGETGSKSSGTQALPPFRSSCSTLAPPLTLYDDAATQAYWALT